MTAAGRYAEAQSAYDEALKWFLAGINAAVVTLNGRLHDAGLPGLDQRTWADDFSQAVANMVGDAETAIDTLKDAADLEANPEDYL